MNIVKYLIFKYHFYKGLSIEKLRQYLKLGSVSDLIMEKILLL